MFAPQQWAGNVTIDKMESARAKLVDLYCLRSWSRAPGRRRHSGGPAAASLARRCADAAPEGHAHLLCLSTDSCHLDRFIVVCSAAAHLPLARRRQLKITSGSLLMESNGTNFLPSSAKYTSQRGGAFSTCFIRDSGGNRHHTSPGQTTCL